MTTTPSKNTQTQTGVSLLNFLLGIAVVILATYMTYNIFKADAYANAEVVTTIEALTQLVMLASEPTECEREIASAIDTLREGDQRSITLDGFCGHDDLKMEISR